MAIQGAIGAAGLIVSWLFWISVGLLGWTYFGYPLLMAVWSKVWSRPIRPAKVFFDLPDDLPTITLLIPAYNEADVIRRKLTNSLQLNYPKDKLEILVVDDGSDDNTASIVREFAGQGVTLLQQPQRGGKVAGMNRGFAAARGEIVVLSDASPDYEINSLPILVRAFADPSVGVVVGKLAIWDAKTAVAKPAGLYWRYEAALRKWETLTGSTVGVHGNMFAIRRSLYKPLQTGTVNDEFSTAMEVIRQGYRVVYEPDAISYDDASNRMGDEFKRRARINAGRYQALFSIGYLQAPNPDLLFRLFSHKLLRPLAPILMLIAFVANVLAVLFALPDQSSATLIPLGADVASLLLTGQIAFYLLAWFGYVLEQNGRHQRLLNVIYFFVSSNLAALVGFWRWLRGSQRVTWQKRSVATAAATPAAFTVGVTASAASTPEDHN